MVMGTIWIRAPACDWPPRYTGPGTEAATMKSRRLCIVCTIGIGAGESDPLEYALGVAAGRWHILLTV